MSVAADTLTLYNRLGYAADQDTSGQFLAWLDGIGQTLQVLDNLCRDGTDTSGNPAPGWSQVLDINRCPTYALAWLAQFVGARVDPTASDAAQRAIISGPFGFNRGTPAAIVAAAAAQLLPGSASPVLSERTTDAYHMSLAIPSAGLSLSTYAAFDAQASTYAALDERYLTYGAMSPAAPVEAAALAQKPGGLVMAFTFF